MTFNPNIDGSKIWTYMHLMASNAVSERKRELYVQWVNSLQESFPCEECRGHLIKNLEILPVEDYSNTNVSLFFHSWKLHDTVNGQLNKPMSQRLTYEQAYAMYFRGNGQMTSSNPGAMKQYRPMNAPRNQKVVRQERYLAGASKPTSIPVEEEEFTPLCTSCGSEPEEFTKRDFTEFRQERRTRYMPKN